MLILEPHGQIASLVVVMMEMMLVKTMKAFLA
jgi:hypothetical protein